MPVENKNILFANTIVGQTRLTFFIIFTFPMKNHLLYFSKTLLCKSALVGAIGLIALMQAQAQVSISYNPFSNNNAKYPKLLKHRQSLDFNLTGYNPLKYAATIEVKTYVINYTTPDIPAKEAAANTGTGTTTDKGASAPADSLKGKVENLVAETSQKSGPTVSKTASQLAELKRLNLELDSAQANLKRSYRAFAAMEVIVENIYALDSWAEIGQQQQELRRLATIVFGTPNISSAQYAERLKQFRADATEHAAIATTLKATADKLDGDLSVELTKAQVDSKAKPKDQILLTAIKEIEGYQATLKAQNDTLTATSKVIGAFSRLIDSRPANDDVPANERLATMGNAYVIINAYAPLRPLARINQQAYQTDEVELTIKLTNRETYKTAYGSPHVSFTSSPHTIPVTGRLRGSVSAGFFSSWLVDHTYGMFADSVYTRLKSKTDGDTTTSKGFASAKRISRTNRLNRPEVGIVTLTHLMYRFTPGLDGGIAVGVGGQTSGLRLMAGFSMAFSSGGFSRVCLSGGVIGGSVTRLADNYATDTPRLSYRSLDTAPTQSATRTDYFLALTYNLTGNRD